MTCTPRDTRTCCVWAHLQVWPWKGEDVHCSPRNQQHEEDYSSGKHWGACGAVCYPTACVIRSCAGMHTLYAHARTQLPRWGCGRLDGCCATVSQTHSAVAAHRVNTCHVAWQYAHRMPQRIARYLAVHAPCLDMQHPLSNAFVGRSCYAPPRTCN